MLHQVFVYGSLLSELANFHVMMKAKGIFIFPAITNDSYYMIARKDKHYPYLTEFPILETQRAVQISGEVYEVDDDGLAILDELECHPTYYLRSIIWVTGFDGSILNAFVYFLVNEDIIRSIKESHDESDFVMNGNWKNWLESTLTSK
jgi:gamma-glutamylcyclotransferase (GGCT)/AIG2-like uncharacterized protein YtfP